MLSIKMAVSIAPLSVICCLMKDCNIIVSHSKTTILLTSGKIQTPTELCVFRVYGNTKWDLEVIGSPENSEAVLKLPLAHPVGLPEKCTGCITDQLTLSAEPHNDWHGSLRKLQTFTSADKTRFSPHTSSSTSLSLETLQSFMLWSSAGDICEPWWIRPSVLAERWAGKLWRSAGNKANMNHEINNHFDL